MKLKLKSISSGSLLIVFSMIFLQGCEVRNEVVKIRFGKFYGVVSPKAGIKKTTKVFARRYSYETDSSNSHFYDQLDALKNKISKYATANGCRFRTLVTTNPIVVSGSIATGEAYDIAMPVELNALVVTEFRSTSGDPDVITLEANWQNKCER